MLVPSRRNVNSRRSVRTQPPRLAVLEACAAGARARADGCKVNRRQPRRADVEARGAAVCARRAGHEARCCGGAEQRQRWLRGAAARSRLQRRQLAQVTQQVLRRLRRLSAKAVLSGQGRGASLLCKESIQLRAGAGQGARSRQQRLWRVWEAVARQVGARVAAWPGGQAGGRAGCGGAAAPASPSSRQVVHASSTAGRA